MTSWRLTTSGDVWKIWKSTPMPYYASRPYYIDGEGNVMEEMNHDNPGAGETPSNGLVTSCSTSGVTYLRWMRLFFRQTRLHPGYADSDRVLLAELGLRGRFRKTDEYLFARRMHRHQATATGSLGEP
jgi:hypothetical protein